MVSDTLKFPNKHTGRNKRTGWNFDKNQISVQGGILIKILEYREKPATLLIRRKTFENIPYFFPKSFQIRTEYLKKSRKIDKLAVPSKSVQGGSLVQIE